MVITIENCSSPGAHFSKNTNLVLQKIHEWIIKNEKPELPFIEFRRRLEKEAKINDNNARNIYPLLKNGGLVEYHPGEKLASGSFFTKRGLAYLKALETKDMIMHGDYTKKQKEEASVQVDEIMGSIVCDSLKKLLKNKELNYSESLRWYLLFLAKYKKINKQEFALMVYTMNQDAENWQANIDTIIQQYRKQEIDIEVKVRIRNDTKDHQSTDEKTRVEDISYFTAYGYYSGLINQAGLTKKVKNYFFVNEDKIDKIDYLLEV
ncbi:hypothetical protein ACQPV1_20725 [Clostridium neonatale]|uniref:hypothetical protein n=1 Tax=Clostridium neonatale TaxID=137838 RepID=UPI003D33A7A8